MAEQQSWLNMVEKYDSMFVDETGDMEDTMLMLRIMAYSEASVVTSMARNIGYHHDPEFDPSNDDPFDAVFKVVIVVRDNPLLAEQAEDEEGIATYHQMVNGAALETIKLWYAVAIMSWEGITYEGIDWNDPRMKALKPSIQLPRKTGSPTVTVFGDVMDSQGRVTSLTVTDKTTPEHAVARMGYATWLWDEVSKLSHEHDFNSGGKLPYRGVSKGKKTTRKRKPKVTNQNKPKSTPAPKSKPSAPKSKPSAPKSKPSTPKRTKQTVKKDETSDTNDTSSKILKMPRPKAQASGGVVMCHTMADVRDVEPRTTFDMKVAQIERDTTKTGKGGLYFYSFFEDESGGLDIDGSDRVWILDDYDAYKGLMEIITENNPEFAEGEEASIDTTQMDIVIRAKKAVSPQKKTAYYRDLEIIKWE